MPQRQIWKFWMPSPGSRIAHDVPQDFNPRHVAIQAGSIYLWADVDPDAPLTPRMFSTVGTGQPFPADSVYLGTVMDEGWVWHVLMETS